MEENETKNQKSKLPIYMQLREIIRNRIEEGVYPPGTAIPSENKLAQTFGVNRLTVRSAVEALVNEGLLQGVQGKGVFVVGEKHEEALESHDGFISEPRSGKEKIYVREFEKSLRYAGNKFANDFDIEPDELIFDLCHLTLIGDTPVSLEEIYVPRAILPELENVDSSVFSIKDIFSFYGINIGSMQQTLEIVSGASKIRKMLDAPDHVALLMLNCEYRDDSGQLIAVSTSYIRSDKSSFSVNMKA